MANQRKTCPLTVQPALKKRSIMPDKNRLQAWLLFCAQKRK